MQGIGSQLSKNVLGMKFMRKTKEELDKAKVEQKHRQHFTSEASQNCSTPSRKFLETIVEEVPSYGQVIGYKFGRISFGGFNPTVEYNVGRGKWKAVHVNPSSEGGDGDSDTEGPPKKRLKSEDEHEPVYGSLIATCGKHFQRKAEAMESDDEEEVPIPLPKKKGGWLPRGFRNDNHKKRRGQNDSRNRKNQPQPPPGKKAKFMKPSEDF